MTIDDWTPVLRTLLLLGIANGAPIFAKKLLRDRWAAPLDGGLLLPDGQPLFGVSKTVRGVVVSIACTALAAAALGLPWRLGAELAILSLLGDLLSSFVKRRLRLPPHAQASGLDQIPEALLPTWLLRTPLGLSGQDIFLVVALFIVLEIVLSRILYRLRIRDRPY